MCLCTDKELHYSPPPSGRLEESLTLPRTRKEADILLCFKLSVICSCSTQKLGSYSPTHQTSYRIYIISFFFGFYNLYFAFIKRKMPPKNVSLNIHPFNSFTADRPYICILFFVSSVSLLAFLNGKKNDFKVISSKHY